MEEAEVEPPHMLLIDEYFLVYKNRRRVFVSGQEPQVLEQAGQRGIPGRAWRAYQNLMAREPAWDRAERYRHLMVEGGHSSVRALARAIGEDFSKVSRALKILDLPAAVLEALRRHGAETRVRAHFTEKRLRVALAGPYPQDLLAEIDAVRQGPASPALQIS